jgi:hypothetical protein
LCDAGFRGCAITCHGCPTASWKSPLLGRLTWPAFLSVQADEAPARPSSSCSCGRHGLKPTKGLSRVSETDAVAGYVDTSGRRLSRLVQIDCVRGPWAEARHLRRCRVCAVTTIVSRYHAKTVSDRSRRVLLSVSWQVTVPSADSADSRLMNRIPKTMDTWFTLAVQDGSQAQTGRGSRVISLSHAPALNDQPLWRSPTYSRSGCVTMADIGRAHLARHVTHKTKLRTSACLLKPACAHIHRTRVIMQRSTCQSLQGAR